MQELGRNDFNSFQLRYVALPMPLHIPATFHDVPTKIKGVIPEYRNVRYVYYNKIR